MDQKDFPPFDLKRLLDTVFALKGGEKVALLIDLPNTALMKDFAFLSDSELSIQRHAHESFYQPLADGVGKALELREVKIFAYSETGGSNLDLPDQAVDPQGSEFSLIRDVYPNYDLILCISTYSATAPLTAFAKQFGFRGATLHGLNDIILQTGLAVDYFEVSKEAEKLRLAMTRADTFEIDFEVEGRQLQLILECNGQEAQKSHGLCREDKPDVANLPAGEVYFVPEGAGGQFPMRYADGSLGMMEVSDGRIQQASLIRGNPEVIQAHNEKLTSDPVTGELGELGFGTQKLPVSGRDIQDEKILGTLHVATGRSDHLGGHLTPDLFAEAKNATHDDILFSPSKTPEISIPQVRMRRAGKTTVVLENFQPSTYLQAALTEPSFFK